MAQFARPDADTSVGNWTASSGSDRYAMIDESSASDSDYITVTDSSGSAEAITLSLSSVTDPADHTSTSVVVRSYTDSFSESVTLNVHLKDGSTSIKSENFSPTTSYSNHTMSLSTSQAASISSYANLTLILTATDGFGMGSETRISHAYFTCPDASLADLTLSASDYANVAAAAKGATIAPTVLGSSLTLSTITSVSAKAATSFDVTVSGITAASAAAKTNHADHGYYWFLIEQNSSASSGMNDSTSNDLYTSQTSAYSSAQSSSVEHNLNHNFADASFLETGEIQTVRRIYLVFSNVNIPPGLEFREVKLSGTVHNQGTVTSDNEDLPSGDLQCELFQTTSADLELPTSLVDTTGSGVGDTLYIIPAIPGENVPNASRTGQNQAFNDAGDWGPLNSFPNKSDDLKVEFQLLWTGPNGHDGLQDDWQPGHNFAMKLKGPPISILGGDAGYNFALKGRKNDGDGTHSGSPVSVEFKYLIRSVTPDPASAKARTPALPIIITPAAASAKAKAFDTPTITTWTSVASAKAATVAPTLVFSTLTLGSITASAKAATVNPTVIQTYTPSTAATATSGPSVTLGSLTMTQPDIVGASANTSGPTVFSWSSTASAKGATVAPSIVFGSVTVSASVSAKGATVAPSLFISGYTVSGIASSTATSATTGPTIFQSTLTMTLGSASAAAQTVFNGTYGADGSAIAKTATSGPTVSITGAPHLELKIADIAVAKAATVFNGTYGASPASAKSATVAPTISTTGGPHILFTPAVVSAAAKTVFNGTYSAPAASAKTATVSPTISTTGGPHIELILASVVAKTATVNPTVQLNTLTFTSLKASAKAVTSGAAAFIPVASAKAQTSGPSVSTGSINITPTAASSAASTAIGSVFDRIVLSAIAAATSSASTYFGTLVPDIISARAITKLGGLPTNIIKVIGKVPSFVSPSASNEAFVKGKARNETFVSPTITNEIFRDPISANELFRDPDVENEKLE